MLSRHFEWRRDVGIRRTITTCLVMAFCLAAALMFLNCRQQQQPAFIITPQIEIEPKFEVRVLLAGDVNRCTIKCPGGFSVQGAAGNTMVPDTIFSDTTLSMDINVLGDEISIGGRNFATRELTILPDGGQIFIFDGTAYRGKLIIKGNVDGLTFDAVNIVPLEPYLAGVVGSEMPDYWEPEALKAQAIAARTYCLYNKAKFGLRRDWDVMKTTASQVYRGIRAESPMVWKAVNQTSGQILVCRQPSGNEEIFPTYYSSSCGGHTEDAKNVFGDDLEPLRGVVCPFCKNIAKPNVFFWPMAQFARDEVTLELQQKYPQLAGLGDITGIAVSKQSDYPDFSRSTMVKLTGSSGASDFLRAEDLRLTIDPSGNKIRSTICKIILMGDRWVFSAGRGFGHGVGLCQCGAEGMARQGKSAVEILSYYYPGSKLTRVY
ncbi:MAG: SpoIID/LytB domain-containing protein [Sedimentisphaerales bacterium]